MERNCERALLVEGGKSYLDALIAMRRFGEATVTTCRRVLERNISELSNRSGVSFLSSEIADRFRPDQLSGGFRGDFASLGVKVINAAKRCRLYTCVNWLPEELNASVSFCVGTSEGASAIYSRLRRYEPEVGLEGNELYLNKKLAPEDMQQLGRILALLSNRWCGALKANGGLMKK